MSSSRRQRWGGSRRTTICRSSSCSKTFRCKTTSSAPRTKPVCANSCFSGSSCIYPKHAPQPIPEAALLTGPLEPTNEAYAIAKIAGIKLCQAYAREYGANFISAMPTNLYGPNDNFDLLSSHVLPALLRKAHEAKKNGAREMLVWGSGKPRREFLHVDDLASACLFLLEKYDSAEIINVGCGEDISIRELAELICDVVGFQRRSDLGHDQARRDAAQTPRCLQTARPGLAPHHRAARRDRADLRMVSCKTTRRRHAK